MSLFTSAPAAATLNSAGGGLFLLKTGEGGGSGTQVSGIQAVTLPIPGRTLANAGSFRATASVLSTYPAGTYGLKVFYNALLLPAPSVTINGLTTYLSFLPQDWIKSRSTVTKSSLTTNVATYTTGSPHGYNVGDVVAVGGLGNTNIDLGLSSGIITGVTSTTFTVALTHADLSQQTETAWAQGFASGTVRAGGGSFSVTATGTAPSPATGKFDIFSNDILNAGTFTAAYPGITLNGATGPETAAMLALIASVSVTSGSLPSPVSHTLRQFALVED